MKPVWVLLVASLLLFHRSWAKSKSVILTCGSRSQPAVVKSSRCSRRAGEQIAGGKVRCSRLSWLGRAWRKLCACELERRGVGGWEVSVLLVCLTSLSCPNSSSPAPCVYGLLSQWVAAVFYKHSCLEAKSLSLWLAPHCLLFSPVPLPVLLSLRSLIATQSSVSWMRGMGAGKQKSFVKVWVKSQNCKLCKEKEN